MSFAFCLSPFLFLLSCGYVADPQPPALNIPGRVTDLSVSQLGGKIVIEFTIPGLTTDGLPLKLGNVDLRAGPNTVQPFDAEAWAAQATRLDTSNLKTGKARVETPLGGWAGSEIFFRVRILSRKGRDGGWSDFVILRVIPPLAKPAGLRAEAVPTGVRLSWSGPQEPPGISFRIRRRAGNQEQPADLASVETGEWIDTRTTYGTDYEYSLQAVFQSGRSRAESEISGAVRIRPEDRFPPAVPSNVSAFAAPDSIELAWDADTEPDLRGYRIYRAEGDGPFERIADLGGTPSYSDRTVKAGRRYRYSVSAIDQVGNESPLSKSVEVTLP